MVLGKKKEGLKRKKRFNFRRLFGHFKVRWKRWIISIVVLLFVLSLVFFPDNPSHDTFLDYIQNIFVWPFVVLAIAVILCFKFSGAITQLIGRGFRYRKGETIVESIPQQEFTENKLSEIENILKKTIKEKEKEFVDAGKQHQAHMQYLFTAWTNEVLIRRTYQSQYNILKFLSQMRRSVPTDFIYENFYKLQYLGKFKGNPFYNFENYINWLVDVTKLVGRVEVEGVKHLQLTPTGLYFLDYVGTMRYSEFEFLPF